MCCSGLGHLLRPSSSGPFIDVGFGQAPIVWPLVCATSIVSFGGLFLGPYSDIHQLVEPRLAGGLLFRLLLLLLVASCLGLCLHAYRKCFTFDLALA